MIQIPRKQFKLAPDAADRRVECESYHFDNGAPRCDKLNHPYCLGVGASPLSCNFREPPGKAGDRNGKTN